MANQKPVDEIRIGRVKATIWRNGTDEQPRHNVTFSPPLQRRRSMEEYAELRAQRLVGACESGRLRPHAPLPASGRSRTPGGSSRRVLAGNRARARRSRSLRRACSFLPASIECLLVVPFRSQRPAVGCVPGQLSRQNASSSLSASVTRVVLSGPCPSPRARSSLFLWFVVLPLPLVKGKHSKPSKETP